MVRAVVERDAHVLHRIPRDVPLLHGFAHALLDRGDEVARDHPADDLVDELEAFAARQRLDLEPAIAELAAAAGLLLVLALRARLALDRLAIRNLRRLELDVDAEFPLEPLDDELHVLLPGSRKDDLPGLGIAVHAQ